MAVKVSCTDPYKLLNSIKAAIANGTVQTWAFDKDGDFTHAPPQWKYKAWLRPAIGPHLLTFNILTPRGQILSKEVYGIYHGRFIEMLAVHFDLEFTEAVATALATSSDVISSR